MKKLLSVTVIAIAIFLGNTLSGHAQVFEKGDKLLNVGVGLGTYGYGGLGYGGSLEVGVTDDISVGPLIGFSGKDYSGYKFSTFTVGGRGSYHLGNLLKLNDDKLDLYAGLGLAYRRVNYDLPSYGGSYGSGILLLAHVGGRYYFSNNIGVFAEVGSGFGTLQAGLAFKF